MGTIEAITRAMARSSRRSGTVHVVEHTIQCEKALRALGWSEPEGRRIVRRIWATRGEHEALAPVGGLAALDARMLERAGSLA